MTSQSTNHSQKANEPIFIWVQYKEEEINNGYWQVYKELQLPHRLFSMFALSFSVAMGYVLLSPESPVSSANTFSELMQIQYLPEILIAGVGIPTTCMTMVFLLLRHLSEGSYRKRPNFHFPMMYLLYPTGIQVQFATGTGMIDWRQFSLALETPQSFCLASSINDVFVLPKRCFASAQEVDVFRNILTANSRNFKKTSSDFKAANIVYEKKAISSVMIDGEQFPIPDMVPPASSIDTTSIDATNADMTNADVASNNSAGIKDAPVSGLNPASGLNPDLADQAYPPSQSLESSLKTGLEVEVLYLSGEIAQAENIYFFRKRLVLLGVIYITGS